MSEQIEANANDVINALSQQIAQLSTDNAALRSILSQYQEKENAE